ncbi:hypothetical protein [Trinickia mobilis]|uniref:hypothetical protein n=1 Tax=Trinickia mobilis TaxID=2816356 RepID=UPI001A8F5001|nr:hypothetical protein [Trinickia mobilis]
MKHRLRPWWFALLIVPGCIAPVARADVGCTEMPLTLATRSEWVARDVTAGGLRMSIARLTFAKTPEVLQAEFEHYWKEAGKPAKGFKGRDGWTLTAIAGECHYIARIPPGADSSGLTSVVLSIARLDGAPVRGVEPDAPAPGRELSTTHSDDAASRARTVVYAVDGTPDAAARQYVERLKQMGWRVTYLAPAGGEGSRVKGMGFAAQRRGAKVDGVVFSGRGATYAVVGYSKGR